MAFGYLGRILRVNLSTANIGVETPEDNFYRKYVGGWGFIGHYLLKELAPETDPLSPHNKLIFATGPVTGAPLAGCGRNAVGAKSPLTGAFGASEVGGFWGAELKRAGYDALIVEGQSERPVYLWIHNLQVEIRDASHLWGRLTADVEECIRQELGQPKARVAQIGPAGERLVRFACIMNDVNRAAGRCGLGAVMGSKKLKGVVVRGSQTLPLACPKKVHEKAKWMADNYMNLAGWLHEHGTDGDLMALDALGGLPTYYFKEGSFREAQNISGETMTKTILVGRAGCYACPIRCKRVVSVEEPYGVEPVYGGPEYETCSALGSLCGIGDLASVAKANQLCAAYGLDTISTGNVIAFVMECFERGLLTARDTGGLELRFGNVSAMVKAVQLIGQGEGFGDRMAEGVCGLANEIGGGASDFAVHIKGQEMPLQEPRIKFGLGLGYATSPTGADHDHAIHDTEYSVDGSRVEEMRALGILEPLPSQDLSPAKVRLALYRTDWEIFKNCAVMCMLVPWDVGQVVEIIEAVTGWNTSAWELMKVGERAMNMARSFNAREGFTAADDSWPNRFTKPLEGGLAKGVAIPGEQMEEAKRVYYQMRGWDLQTGAPTQAKLDELGLSWAVEEVKRGGTQRCASLHRRVSG